MDSQVLEMVGKHRLIEELLAAGLEVALPARDRGIDLIAYADVDVQLGQFTAVPIQMKATAQSSFSIDRKYSKFFDILIAYVWNVSDPANTQIYVLTQQEAVTLATRMGYTATDSWRNKGIYTVTRPSRRLLERLSPYRMTSEKWLERVRNLNRR